jgi:hypothetical protein
MDHVTSQISKSLMQPSNCADYFRFTKFKNSQSPANFGNMSKILGEEVSTPTLVWSTLCYKNLKNERSPDFVFWFI